MHNAEEWIRETLQSVVDQTYPNWEMIIVDDGSTDDSMRRACDFQEQVTQKVTLISTSQRGVSAARNLGWRSAQGDFVAFLDADDLWRPRKLELQFAELRMNPQLEAVSSYFATFSQSDERVKRVIRQPWTLDSVMKWMLLEGPGLLISSTPLIKFSALEECGGFDEQLGTAADLDFAWRLTSRRSVSSVRVVLVDYRLHQGQMSQSVDLLKNDYSFLFEKEPFRGNPSLTIRMQRRLNLLELIRMLRGGKFRAALQQACSPQTMGIGGLAEAINLAWRRCRNSSTD